MAQGSAQESQSPLGRAKAQSAPGEGRWECELLVLDPPVRLLPACKESE